MNMAFLSSFRIGPQAVYPEGGLIFVTQQTGYVGVWSIDDNGAIPPRFTVGGPKGILEKPRGLDIDPKHNAVIVSEDFLKKNPEAAKKFIAAYKRGVDLVRNQPAEARQFMKGYTAIEGALTNEVPLASYMLHDEFKPSDVAYFQKFYDLFFEKQVFEKRVLVEPLLYRG